MTPPAILSEPTADSPVNLQQPATLVGTAEVCGPCLTFKCRLPFCSFLAPQHFLVPHVYSHFNLLGRMEDLHTILTRSMQRWWHRSPEHRTTVVRAAARAASIFSAYHQDADWLPNASPDARHPPLSGRASSARVTVSRMGPDRSSSSHCSRMVVSLDASEAAAEFA